MLCFLFRRMRRPTPAAGRRRSKRKSSTRFATPPTPPKATIPSRYFSSRRIFGLGYEHPPVLKSPGRITAKVRPAKKAEIVERRVRVRGADQPPVGEDSLLIEALVAVVRSLVGLICPVAPEGLRKEICGDVPEGTFAGIKRAVAGIALNMKSEGRAPRLEVYRRDIKGPGRTCPFST